MVISAPGSVPRQRRDTRARLVRRQGQRVLLRAGKQTLQLGCRSAPLARAVEARLLSHEDELRELEQPAFNRRVEELLLEVERERGQAQEPAE